MKEENLFSICDGFYSVKIKQNFVHSLGVNCGRSQSVKNVQWTLQSEIMSLDDRQLNTLNVGNQMLVTNKKKKTST